MDESEDIEQNSLTGNRAGWSRLQSEDKIILHCIICGDKARPNYYFCEPHLVEYRSRADGSCYASWIIAHSAFDKHPLFAEQMCPRCEVNLKEGNDYLCEGCRYGH
jgi:hypothetical protein